MAMSFSVQLDLNLRTFMCEVVHRLHKLENLCYMLQIQSKAFINMDNSRDWSEIIWLPKNSHFKINLPIGLYPKKPTGMHWLGRNDAVP